MKYKNRHLSDQNWNSLSVAEGSVAVQVGENFNTSMDEMYGFSQFQKNLSHLKDRVSQLSFMVSEVRDVLKQRS